MASFSIKESFSYGWKSLQDHFWPMAGIAAGALVISSIFNAASNALVAAQEMGVAGAVNVISFLVNAYVFAGALQLAFKLYDGGEVSMNDFKVRGKVYLNTLLAMILSALIVVGGLILLIVPGLIWLTTYYFSAYITVDKDMTARQALHESRLATKGDRWRIAGLMILAVLLNIAGLIAFIVGIFVTLPVTVMAYVYAYRKLAAKLEPAEPAPLAPAAPAAPAA
jgi:uncharacterized membrane protein